MLDILRTRLKQKYRTMDWPAGPAPALGDRFAGRPAIRAGSAPGCHCCAVCSSGGGSTAANSAAVAPLTPDPGHQDCRQCQAVCPTGAMAPAGVSVQIDTGRCLFCRRCERACPSQCISFTAEYRLASARREDLIVRPGDSAPAKARSELAAKLFDKSLKLRQVSAGGCGACEADANVLGTLAWDMGRFGIGFVASPRHADGLLVTGPVTGNMRLALEKTYAAIPSPKIVIASGACAISGGPYIDLPRQEGGAASVVPVDLFVPGCPPHPLTLLEGLLRFLGRID